MDKEKVLDYVMHSPGNSNRAVLSGMLDESGEGNSDFSTAEVTLTAPAGNYYIPNIVDNPAAIASWFSFREKGTAIITVPLYQGCCGVNFDSIYTITTSGDITQEGQLAIITGDGSITLTQYH